LEKYMVLGVNMGRRFKKFQTSVEKHYYARQTGLRC